MTRKKGFIRVFEAIIASIILIASLTFFFQDTSPPSGWDSTSLKITAQDALQSAYLNGTITRFVRTNDKDSINEYFSQMLPKTIDYSIVVKGMPNDIIRVACVDCSVAEEGELEAILNPLDFEYRNRKISIRPQRLDWTHFDLPEDANTVFFFDKARLVLYEAKIRDFLKKGGSVMLLSDLVQADVNGPAGTIFNLSWSGGGSVAPGALWDIYDGRNVSHFVAKYYANISGKNLENAQADTFTVFHSSSIIGKNDARNIIRDVTNKVFARANFDIENSEGRAVWVNDYTRLNHNDPSTSRIDKAVKASLMWASGEKYTMDKSEKDLPPVHFRSSIVVYDIDTYIFELVVWRAFF